MFCSDEFYESEEAVEEVYPDHAMIIRVEHGWMVFYTMSEYRAWSNQK